MYAEAYVGSVDQFVSAFDPEMIAVPVTAA
jgi:hypothetical protein